MKWLFAIPLALSVSTAKAQYTQQGLTFKPAVANHGENVILEAVFYIASHGDEYSLKHTITRSPSHPTDSLCVLNLVRVPKGITLPVASYDKFIDTLRNLSVGRYRLAFDTTSFLKIPVKDSVYFQVVDVHVLGISETGRRPGGQPSWRLLRSEAGATKQGLTGPMLWRVEYWDVIGRHEPRLTHQP